MSAWVIRVTAVLLLVWALMDFSGGQTIGGYVMEYKQVMKPQCCIGWLSQTQGAKDCDIAVCFGRNGNDRGTCMNGGKCLSPDICQCLDGFTLPRCTDVDECTESTHACSHNCTNTVGSYTCSCPDKYGLMSDGKTCGPVCFGIHPPGECLNKHKCLRPDNCDCAEGYLQPKCEDEDECASGPCQQICTNTPGSFRCSCEEGFDLQPDGRTCDPQCLHVPRGECPHGGTCVKPGICACLQGFSPPDCQDIDECTQDNDCKQSCQNTVGSFTCGCDTGYKLTADGLTCEDVDECGVRNGGCVDICLNSPGSFSCECSTGLAQLSDGKTCAARCRADWALGVCPNGGTCELTGRCACLTGFEGKECDNINECEQNNGGCSHKCKDTPGNFTCTCPPGFVLQNRRHCEDVDECQGKHGCDGICVNHPGSFSCQCGSGLVLRSDRVNCEDVDECELGSHGCSHICHNTYGSYRCQCEQDYTLMSADGKTCLEKRLCTDEEQSSCWPKCEIDGNGVCACPEGMTLYVDQMHCIDPCTSSPCLHGGQCKPNKNFDYICDCSSTGYSGDDCQYGSIEFPLNFDARKSVTYNNLTIRVTSDEDTIIHASSAAHVTIFPNPITIWKSEDSFNMSLRAEDSGITSVKFTITNSQIRRKKYSMKVRSTDVFSRHQLLSQQLPEGCFYLQLSEMGLSQVFRSTKPWFRMKIDKKIYFTFGITYLVVPKCSLPLSSDGLQVTFGSSLHIARLTSRRKQSHGIRHYEARDNKCQALHFTSIEMNEFMHARSLLRTFFKNLRKALPYWFTFDVTPVTGIRKIPQFYQTKMMSGKLLKNFKHCQSLVVEDDAIYTVFLFTDGIQYRMAGNLFDIPVTTESTPYCFVVDFEKTDTFMTAFYSDMGDTFGSISIADSLTKLKNVSVNPRVLGITKGWDHRTIYNNDLVFYNGGSMFKYPNIGKVTWFTHIHAHKTFKLARKDTFGIDVVASVYSDIERATIFTHLFTKKTNYFLTVRDLKFTFSVNILGRRVTLEANVFRTDDAAIISTGGDKGYRVSCASVADPPGVFYRTTLRKLITKNTYFLDPLMTLEGEAFFFLTFDQKKSRVVGANVKRLEGIFSVLSSRVSKFKTFLNKMKKRNMPTWKKDMILDMAVMSTNISDFALNLDRSNLTVIRFADFTHDILIKTRELSDMLDVLESRLHVSFDPDAGAPTKRLRKAFELVHGQVKGIWWENYDSSTPFFPEDDVLGIKSVVNIRFLGIFLDIDVDLVFSSEDLMRCSDLREYYDHVAGGTVIRGKGVIAGGARNLATARYQTLYMFWDLFPPVIGGGIELAFSRTKPVFALRLLATCKVFDLQVTLNLFITNNEVAAMAEVTIFKMFRVRLTLGFAVPRKVTAIAIWIQGEFLPGSDQSFQSTLWDAVKRALKSYHRNAEYRLQEAENNIATTQTYVKAAKNKIKEAQRKLGDNEAAFEASLRHFDKAIARLEAAKEPFRNAQTKLNRARNKVDNLCKLQDCHRKCQVKLDTTQCKKNKMTGSMCIKTQPCYTTFAEVGCLMKNAGCRVIRGLAYAALEAAKIVVSLPMIALDAAKVAVSLAQIVVDKSKFLLDVSKSLYSMAYTALSILENTLNAVLIINRKLYGLLSTVFSMFDALITNTLQKFIDIRGCGFRVELSVKNWFLINCYCEINFMSRGWTSHSFTVNFKDMFSSMFGIANSTVDKARSEGAKSRRRRFADSTQRLASTGFNDSDIGGGLKLEYDSWASKCRRLVSIVSFLNASLEILSNFSRHITEDADAAERNIVESSDKDDGFGKLTLDNVGVDLNVALEDFNLTLDDLERALAAARLENDELLLATADFKTTLEKHNRGVVQTVRDSSVRLSWLSHMDTVIYSGDCLNFRDCVAWSLGELNLLLDSVTPDVADHYRDALVTLGVHFQDLITNESKTINQTTHPDIDLSVLVNLNDIFCGSLPILLETPENVTAQVGHVAKFNCVASGKPLPTYYWFSDYVLMVYGKNWTTLTLNNISFADEGVFSCVVGNHIGNVSSAPVRLHVAYPPEITIDLPTVYNLRAGDDGAPNARLEGKPRPNVIWSICSQEICRHEESKQFPGLPDNFLSGELIYKYKGYNKYGEVESAEMLVVVYDMQPATPEKVLHIWYTVSLVDDDLIDGADDFQHANRSTMVTLLQSELSKTYAGPKGLLEVEIMSADLDKQYIALTIRPKRELFQITGKTANLVERVLMEINSSVVNILKDAGVGGVMYNDTVVIYAYSLADEVREEPTKFHCKRSWVFQPPSYCVRRPQRLQLEPPEDVRVLRSEDDIHLRWKPPFYDGFLLKDYTVHVIPESGPPVRQNTSSREPTFSLPASTCGAVCEIQVSALTASHRSKWAVRKVYLKSAPTSPDERSSHKLSTAVTIPIGVLSTLAVICAVAAAVAFYKHRAKSRVVTCSTLSGLNQNISTDPCGWVSESTGTVQSNAQPKLQSFVSMIPIFRTFVSQFHTRLCESECSQTSVLTADLNNTHFYPRTLKNHQDKSKRLFSWVVSRAMKRRSAIDPQ